MPTMKMPDGTIKRLPYDKETPAPQMPMMEGGPSPDNMKGMLVNALRGIKNAADQQGLDFDALLAEAQGSGKKPMAAPPMPPMMGT